MAVQPLASQVGVAPACRALGVPRASFYRRQRPAPGHQQPRPTPARALRASERAHVLDVLASPRFVDRSPAEVVVTLLDEGRYLCAERTMYRKRLVCPILLRNPVFGLTVRHGNEPWRIDRDDGFWIDRGRRRWG